MPTAAWRGGFAIAAADLALETLKAPWFREEVPPTTPIERIWLSELREGLDVYGRIVWCLRFGYIYAAAALTRRYIERWTYNLAFSYEIDRPKGLTDVEYFRHVWARQPAHLVEADVGSDWAALSEILHGRSVPLGSRTMAVELDLKDVDRRHVSDFIVRCASAPLNQVRVCVGLAAANQQNEEIDRMLVAPLSAFDFDVVEPSFLSVFLEPPDYDFVTSERSSTLRQWGQAYRRIVRRSLGAPLELRSFHAWMPLEERWVRAGDEARRAFVLERHTMGDAFDPDVLRGRLIRLRAITEMTGLVATSTEARARKQALRAAAAAMESAWVLWLQDVDDSMTCVRGAIESVARARTHRLKPTKAARMEAQATPPSPSRWVEAAGWRRMSVFVRALSELAHIQERSRHRSSRALLTALQGDVVPASAASTARGHALEKVQMLLAHETAAGLAETHTKLAASFREHTIFETEAESEASLSDWLERAFALSNHDFGPSELARSQRKGSAE
ncbi:hypothetical protein [Microbacterium dextranolyticum]|uniref:hypothetical protein n=1 Tax=Microbacterium dextranolyticum TaxID=36806 RepID=UPI00195E51EC|nr:hypothetical protein [Microbacterium dextranolyticum]MBM7462091.1 hypothetical protein [Microbacterium dextranolyticum]